MIDELKAMDRDDRIACAIFSAFRALVSKLDENIKAGHSVEEVIDEIARNNLEDGQMKNALLQIIRGEFDYRNKYHA